MAALSKYVKQRIVSLKERGLTNRGVVAILKREGDMVHVTTQIVRRCRKRYVETGRIERRQGSGRPTLRTAALLQTIEDIMQADNEATVVQIRSRLTAVKPEAAITQHNFACPTRTGLDVPRVSVLPTYSPGKQGEAS